MTQRGLPRKGAASSLPCAGLLPPQSAEANLCRVRPLQHSEWRAAARHSLCCNGHHSTIVYSLKTMERDMKNDQHLRETVSDIIKNVKA